jgi:hypothetical protein
MLPRKSFSDANPVQNRLVKDDHNDENSWLPDLPPGAARNWI